jgi:hypothetical protein
MISRWLMMLIQPLIYWEVLENVRDPGIHKDMNLRHE